MPKFLLVALSLMLLACSRAETPQPAVVQLSHDFFVSAAPKDYKARVTPRGVTTRAQCEKEIAKALCETSLPSDSITSDFSKIKCGTDSRKYTSVLMKIYDETPELMRASLCTLDRIFVSDGFHSTAFASAIQKRSGEVVGAYIGIRKDTLLKQPDSKELLTWKEQLAFGGAKDFLSNDPKLVQVAYNLKLSHLETDGLFYVLMHELGHLVDFKNDINDNNPYKDWLKLSWLSETKPRPEAKFALQKEFCSYKCKKTLAPERADEIYSSLARSSFLTTYSGMNPWEDFAEFWAWHLSMKYKGADLRVTLPGKPEFSLTSEWSKNPKIAKKFAVIEDMWNSRDLIVDNRARR